MFCSNFKALNRFAEQKKLVNSDLVLSEFDEDTTDSSLGFAKKIAVGGRTDGHGGVGSLLCGGNRDEYRLVDGYKRQICGIV